MNENRNNPSNDQDGSKGPDLPDPLTDHAYDGIREYDNPLPGWWKVLFIGTIVFSGLYFIIDITTSGQMSPVASYDQSVVEDAKRRFGSMVLKPDAVTLLKLSKDPLFQKMGESIFQTNCVSCHGRHAEGMACPNLTANNYIHVKKIEDFVDVITKGRNNGAMPAWGNRLQPNEIIVVASYAASLRNTNYPGGRKKPEGTIIPPPWTDH
jgi:cytochrome c oxidase cbb3-type subunit 3